MKIAACVILYHPKEKDLQNIETYLSKVDKLYVYDNTENASSSSFLEESSTKIIYFSDHENKGISARLNQACTRAVSDGYDLLLTMDQDSSFLEEKLESYLKLVSNYPNIENIAQFGLQYTDQEIKTENQQIQDIEDYALITSASIIVLKNFNKIGGFDENLFIDGVDFDYCLAAKEKGLKCILFKNLFFVHTVGAKIKRRSLKTFYLLKKEKYLCSPIRIYYLVRNILYLKQKYGAIFPEYIEKLVKTNNTSIATNRNYSKNIFEFYKYKRKAISDFKNKKMGKIEA
ncbi:glycosyltransferase [Flavobacterium sp. ZT3R18]|uniref:glycosyltransferase n=1 Tax=Flavobacterium sp. ZT3R18 TaxID=2594429 RepID=UPI00117ABC04|nr:glycosyltransferase [Flavobacterium sp. ZT3R18]TRX36879.1 glycosyltransferase [Flavobacterium sp. ZT3R18]